MILVEFGSYRGGSAYMMLSATQGWTPPRSMYLYDTFSGIPAEGLTTRERESAFEGRFKDTSVDAVMQLMARFAARVQIRAGVIPQSLEVDGPGEIAFMHIDLNAAKPTLDALEWAFPLWSPHGICLLDDYLYKGYEEQRDLVEDFFASKGLEIVGLPTGQGFVVKH